MQKSRFILFIIALLSFENAWSQNKWLFGINAAGNVSRVSVVDTFPQNFSRRNRIGYSFGLQGSYDIKRFVSLSFAVNYVNKGYKINNDTLLRNPSVVHKISTLNVPLGLIFRQNFSGNSFIHEKAGLILNYSLRKDSVTLYNSTSTPRFRVTDISQNIIYPMFYLGFGIGGKLETGDRYEFTVTYNQSFATDGNLSVQYGTNYLKKFPLNYRGGFIQFGFSYYFNLSNFKKSDEYFYD
jgi:hypothetical protein